MGLVLHSHLSDQALNKHLASAVYAANGRLDQTFLDTTLLVLKGTASLKEELSRSFEIAFDGSVGGVSRVAATLNLAYHYVRLFG